MERMDLRTRGEGRVSWNEVREWNGLIYTTKGKIGSLVGRSHITQGHQLSVL